MSRSVRSGTTVRPVRGGTTADNHAEGWYSDPFGRHDARWMSDGTPTKLVRDGEEESYDDPPHEEPSVIATKVEEVQASDGTDLLRAGDPAGASR